MSDDHLPGRPKRRYVKLEQLVEVHGARCAHCAAEGVPLDRCHVIDRERGGLDHLGNMRPQCKPCHRSQPSFGPHNEELALRWFAGEHVEQPPMMTAEEMREWVTASRAAQGLPPKVTDAAVLAAVAAVLTEEVRHRAAG